MAGLIALGFAYVLSQFYRSFLAVLTPALRHDIGATTEQLAQASGAWFLAFAAMQFIVGVALDRYGPRRTASLMLGIAGTSGGLLFAYAQSPMMVTVGMALIGIGCSPVLMASLYIFARQFKPQRFALLVSLVVGFGGFGNIVGASPMAAAADIFGWRAVMLFLTLITFLTAIAIYILVRDPEVQAEQDDVRFSGYFELLAIKPLWFIVLMTMFYYSVAAGIRGLWSGPYLNEVFGADALSIGRVTLFMAIAMVVGTFVYGPLDNVFNTRKWLVSTGSAILIFATGYLALFPKTSVAMVAILFIIIGLAGAGYGVTMAHSKSFFPPHLIGRGVTLMNFFSIGGAGLMQYLTGKVVVQFADPTAPEAAYVALFSFYTIVMAIALAIYLFSKDSPPRPSV